MGILIWLLILSLLIVVTLISCFIIIFKLFPGIRYVLQQMLQREQSLIATINKIKMVIKFEEGVDLDDKQNFPYTVQVSQNEEDKKL